jgi:hypothetical protein
MPEVFSRLSQVKKKPTATRTMYNPDIFPEIKFDSGGFDNAAHLETNWYRPTSLLEDVGSNGNVAASFSKRSAR